MSVRRLDQSAGAGAERAPEEAELERDHHRRGPSDHRPPADHGLLLAGVLDGTGDRGAVTLPVEGAIGR